MATLHRDAAEGIHRIEHAHVNLYLVEGDRGEYTVVDAGLPGVWPHLGRLLGEVGAKPDQVAAVVLTHAHFDHVGAASAIQKEWHLPVWSHSDERQLAAHPLRYQHERNRFAVPLAHPKSLPIIARMTLAGALVTRGVKNVHVFDQSRPLDVPGKPAPVFTPGHTFGHTALYFPDRNAVITGDALVTLDPYTGGTGPQIVSGAATADSAQALESLTVLRDTGATIVLPGHGEVWTGGIADATDLATRRGPH
ncbi:MBL fold metallo-hydrolase [Mycobacterium sp. 1423905.2]|uniref:MBL fold metallo-hydrolase n=1 Tax=Mycobacterium sp. 1423905.2 TaxID=1856859 RepID=UPI000801D164|nr:MBL fold metallo-hydrolase [Mycobacterium sp. 1423905.2]OBJ55639.1 Zn-dependent hydrolase [Mycobacterium sp. 1423905.2]